MPQRGKDAPYDNIMNTIKGLEDELQSDLEQMSEDHKYDWL